MTADKRKAIPVFTGVLKYFPDALKEIAKVSVAGNTQHLKGQPLHWDRTKSMDQMDAAIRHILDYASGEEIDEDGIPHLCKAGWRILAQIQLDYERKTSAK